jgi:probable HAF family extracellular repeat protein
MARAIDERGRVVGQSRNASGQNRAFLWKDGKMTNLNSLIPTGSSLRLLDAYAIGASGKIVGSALDERSQVRAFLLTPNDTTAPKIECEDPDGLWHGQDVSIPCKADDAETGLADPADANFSLSTSVPDGAETADARTGTRKVCDAAGNCATAGPVGGNRVDKKAPDIEINAPAAGAEYRLGEAVAAGYACPDGGSGTTSCVGSIPNGGSLDTASVGPKSFTVEAADEVGNVASESRAYGVVYDFGGFFSPVDNPDVLNRVQAGSAVPVKFGLSGDQGLDIFAEGYPRSQRIGCDSTAPVDNTEQAASAGESGLTYDAAADRYGYVWKTSKAWGDTCRQLVVKLDDGTVHQATFRFR